MSKGDEEDLGWKTRDSVEVPIRSGNMGQNRNDNIGKGLVGQ